MYQSKCIEFSLDKSLAQSAAHSNEILLYFWNYIYVHICKFYFITFFALCVLEDYGIKMTDSAMHWVCEVEKS